MSETDEYILDAITSMVWSGFYTADDVDVMIDDLLEEDADEELLRAAVEPEFARKAEAEKTWPAVTDCDRLDQAFAALDARGIIALHNAGLTMSDGLTEVFEVQERRGRDRGKGYCFYHGQDLDRAVAGAGLLIAFGAVDDNEVDNTEIGRTVRDVLRSFGLTVEWNGTPTSRLNLFPLDWKRRGPAFEESA